MKLAYQAVDAAGQAVSQTIEAADAQQATQLLRQKGLFVTHIQPLDDQADGSGPAPAARQRVGGTRRLKFLSAVTRQLHILTSTGTPVVQALEAAEQQTDDPLARKVLQTVRQDVEQGDSLAQAMANHPHWFNPVFTSVVAAGEASGNLPPILKRLADLSREQLQLRRTLTGAMIYPTMMLGLGMVVLAALLLFVVPRFAGMFQSLNTPLPPTTKVLLLLSFTLRDYWWAVLAVLAAVGYGLFWLAGTETGRTWVGQQSLKLPRFGPLIQSVLTARIVRLLGVLLDSRVEMLEALALVRRAAGNPAYAQLMAQAEEKVGMGEPLSRVFADSPLINISVTQAIRNGESSGQLGPLLLNVADYLEEDNRVAIQGLSSMLEPLILMFLGVVVGGVAVSMFLPLFDLTAAGGGL